MCFKSFMDYLNFAADVTGGYRYIHSKKVENFLAILLKTSDALEISINKNCILYRAQLGNSYRDILDSEEVVHQEPAPFPKERMKPLRFQATEGRANPKGIPFLYLASNKETAMSEIRPWRSAKISLALFKTIRTLKIVDVCKYQIDEFSLFFTDSPTKEDIIKAVWSEIGKAFSKPLMNNDKVAAYVPTQIISEFFKNNGFDGIAYKSSQSDGYNLVLFDIDTVKLWRCHLYEAENIKYEFKEFKSVSYQINDEA